MASLPRHIAIVMDGNGRWAKARLMPRVAGHRAGLQAVRKVIKACATRGIPVLSLFAFSSENWRRPKEEVESLMSLFLSGLEGEVGELHEHNIQLRFIGCRDRFSDVLRRKMEDVEMLTALNTGMVLIIAVDYGGQWDICQAVKKLCVALEAGLLKSDDVTPEKLAAELSFAHLPDPDLFIRTSGEMRISNFMLWQLAYAELYFTPVFWPDFDESALDAALHFYASRERRFGASTPEK